jgi:hypothetical protein
MLHLIAAASLAFALNAEPAPKPYGPAVEHQPVERISPTPVDTAETTRAPVQEAQSRDNHANRAYACVDDACKTVSPVYNARTPAQADARSFRASW